MTKKILGSMKKGWGKKPKTLDSVSRDHPSNYEPIACFDCIMTRVLFMHVAKVKHEYLRTVNEQKT